MSAELQIIFDGDNYTVVFQGNPCDMDAESPITKVKSPIYELIRLVVAEAILQVKHETRDN